MRFAPALLVTVLAFAPGCNSKQKARQDQHFTALMDEKIRPVILSAKIAPTLTGSQESIRSGFFSFGIWL